MTETKKKPPAAVGEKIMATADEAASMLAIGRSTFWAQVKANRLPQPVKIGGATRWRVADLRLVGSPASSPTTPSAHA